MSDDKKKPDHWTDKITLENQLKATEELWHESDVRVGELQDRLALMWKWIGQQEHCVPFLFTDTNPEAADWFDEDGRVK